MWGGPDEAICGERFGCFRGAVIINHQLPKTTHVFFLVLPHCSQHSGLDVRRVNTLEKPRSRREHAICWRDSVGA
jgi:hypothetical protein